MKELERNFREPEESFFFDQLFVECVETEADASGWATLSEIVDLGVTEAQQYEDELTGETDNPPQAFEDLTSYGQSVQEYLKEEIRSRILPGKYSERYRTSQLPDEGIVDVRFTRDVDELSQGERELLATSVEQNHRYEPSLIDEVENGHEHLDSLIAQGYLRRVEDDGSRYVMLEEDVIECAVVGEETPIFYAPNEENFITTLKTELKDGGGGLVEFTATPEDRASFSHPHFNLTAQQITTSDPMMLLARAYYGETDREERRELEYQFRQGRYPHFLSSGPAMELGVDIGDLNTLLLYGTPPNANSYLQRIGRAGRESGNSLVHSVSQRNPIDYYYHEHPEELIASDPQQVPLNEVNLEVLHQSLTWAILDWIATTRWIPWRMDQSGLDELVVYRDESSDRSEPRPNDILRFTEILSSSNFQLQSQGEDAPLEALRTVIDENTDEVQKWLRDLIAFGVCTDCGRKHTDGYNGECQRDGCDGTVESILDKHSNLAEGVLSGADDRLGFEEAIIDLYNDQWSDIDGDLEDIDDELSDVRREERRTRDRDEKLELRERKNQLRRRADQLDDYLRRLEDMDFGQYLNRESPAAFGLRSVGDSVEVVE
ncbi:helicase-related protein [Halorubrum sp. F4]|uniref:helicase-related protein n=1 Tax=Halorubrum sp. F4 TaxID=2989715 RepID=UPI002481769E|nr:helicase-related protein [Halorubrum sp. F4]